MCFLNKLGLDAKHICLFATNQILHQMSRISSHSEVYIGLHVGQHIKNMMYSVHGDDNIKTGVRQLFFIVIFYIDLFNRSYLHFRRGCFAPPRTLPPCPPSVRPLRLVRPSVTEGRAPDPSDSR